MKARAAKKGKKKSTPRKGPNLKVVGAFAIALFALTVLLFQEGAKACVVDLPDSSKFRYEPWMVFANSEMNSFRMIEVERAVRLGGSDLKLFGDALVSLYTPDIEIKIADVDRVIQVSYPLAEQGVTVNILKLQSGTKDILITQLEKSEPRISGNESGTLIFNLQAKATLSRNPQGRTNAYIAITESDLYYVEGYSYSLQMLTRTVKLGKSSDNAYMKTQLLMHGYALLTGGLKNIVGFSLLEFKEKTNGVKYVMKAVAVDSGQTLSRQVLIFETQNEFDANINAAKSTFIDRRERACSAEQYLLGSQFMPLDQLRTALQGL